MALKSVLDSASLFPFRIFPISADHLVAVSDRLDALRHGLDQDLIMLRTELPPEQKGERIVTLLDDRLHHLVRFYEILDMLAEKIGGARILAECTGRMKWPKRGVYFFQEYGETRSDSGTGPRIVRVGTHALKTGSRTTLWNRLSQHRGSAKTGAGNHRASIFRLLVGTALSTANGMQVPSWGRGSSAPKPVREKEKRLEELVSRTIGQMAFLWLDVPDPPGPDSLRGLYESLPEALVLPC